MTREEFSKIVKGMKSVYSDPKFIADQDAFNMWYALLEDLDYKTLADAVKTYMMTNSKNPTPADIRGQVANRDTANQVMGEGEAWSLVMKALSNSSYHAEEEYAKLPPLVQKAIGSPGNMRNLAKAEDFNEQVEHSLFRRSYEAYVNRAKEDAKLPDYLKKGVGICAESSPLLEQSV